MQLNLSIRVN